MYAARDVGDIDEKVWEADDEIRGDSSVVSSCRAHQGELHSFEE